MSGPGPVAWGPTCEAAAGREAHARFCAVGTTAACIGQSSRVLLGMACTVLSISLGMHAPDRARWWQAVAALPQRHGVCLRAGKEQVWQRTKEVLVSCRVMASCPCVHDAFWYTQSNQGGACMSAAGALHHGPAACWQHKQQSLLKGSCKAECNTEPSASFQGQPNVCCKWWLHGQQLQWFCISTHWSQFSKWSEASQL